MDSIFNNHFKSAGDLRSRASASAQRQGYAQAGAQGYRLSSDELNSGLDVHTVALTALPVELVTELIRLRRTWDGVVPVADTRVLN